MSQAPSLQSRIYFYAGVALFAGGWLFFVGAIATRMNPEQDFKSIIQNQETLIKNQIQVTDSLKTVGETQIVILEKLKEMDHQLNPPVIMTNRQYHQLNHEYQMLHDRYTQLDLALLDSMDKLLKRPICSP